MLLSSILSDPQERSLLKTAETIATTDPREAVEYALALVTMCARLGHWEAAEKATELAETLLKSCTLDTAAQCAAGHSTIEGNLIPNWIEPGTPGKWLQDLKATSAPKPVRH